MNKPELSVVEVFAIQFEDMAEYEEYKNLKRSYTLEGKNEEPIVITLRIVGQSNDTCYSCGLDWFVSQNGWDYVFNDSPDGQDQTQGMLRCCKQKLDRLGYSRGSKGVHFLTLWSYEVVHEPANWTGPDQQEECIDWLGEIDPAQLVKALVHPLASNDDSTR